MTTAEPPPPEESAGRGGAPDDGADGRPACVPVSAECGNRTHAYRALTAVERMIGNRPARF